MVLVAVSTGAISDQQCIYIPLFSMSWGPLSASEHSHPCTLTSMQCVYVIILYERFSILPNGEHWGRPSGWRTTSLPSDPQPPLPVKWSGQVWTVLTQKSTWYLVDGLVNIWQATAKILLSASTYVHVWLCIISFLHICEGPLGEHIHPNYVCNMSWIPMCQLSISYL